jgi:hypothetical protein
MGYTRDKHNYDAKPDVNGPLGRQMEVEDKY